MKFHTRGKPSRGKCVRVHEPKDYSGGWNNNYLCVPQDSDYFLSWTHNQSRGHYSNCVDFKEPKEPSHKGWNNNSLCVHLKEKTTPLKINFSNSGFNQGVDCLEIRPPRNKSKRRGTLCLNKDIGLRYYHYKYKSGMNCVALKESSKQNNIWKHDHLCLPANSPYSLKWVKNPKKSKGHCTQIWANELKKNTTSSVYSICIEKPLPGSAIR